MACRRTALNDLINCRIDTLHRLLIVLDEITIAYKNALFKVADEPAIFIAFNIFNKCNNNLILNIYNKYR